MQLCVDIGNTMAVFAFFGEDSEVKKIYRSKSFPERSYDEWKVSFKLFIQSESLTRIKGAIVSSVVPSLAQIVVPLIKELFGVEAKVIGPGIKTGMRINTDNPKEVGADLIADAVGALSLFGPDCLIVDLGTANKIIHLDHLGQFDGCTIAPGLGLGLNALVSNTAVLPEVSLQIPHKIIGKNTSDSMNSGLLYGTAYSLLGMAEAIEKEVGRPLKRILTGGYSHFIKELLPSFTYEPHLLVKGLLHILNKYGD